MCTPSSTYTFLPMTQPGPIDAPPRMCTWCHTEVPSPIEEPSSTTAVSWMRGGSDTSVQLALIEHVGTERERGGDGRRSFDDLGEVLARGRGVDHRRITEGFQHRTHFGCDGDGLHVGQCTRLRPHVDGRRRTSLLRAPILIRVAVATGVAAHGSSPASSSSGRRPSARRSWSLLRSASELERGSTTSAIWRFPATTSSTRSSIVPGQTSRWEITVRFWPMRHARSRAWSSTAGFHHRSYRTTWLAAVRFSPVPPAFNESTSAPAP